MKTNLFSTCHQPTVVDDEQRRAVSSDHRTSEGNNPKGILLGLLLKRFGWSVALLFLVLFASCSEKEPATADETKSGGPESRVHHGTNGEVIITLDAATQKLMGLRTAPLAATELPPEMKCFGRVLDPAALAGVVADYLSAQAIVRASEKELGRVKTLAAQTNISVRALETAQATTEHDQALAAAAHARLLGTAGKALAGRSDLFTLVQSLTTGDSALVRMDLPAGGSLKSEPAGARLVSLDENAAPIDAKFISAAPSVDPQTQAQGFLFLVEANSSRLVPGAAVTGFLKLSGEAQAGVFVPRDAVLRFNGAAWVYIQAGPDDFSRTQVLLDRPVTEGWFEIKGLKPQQHIVTVGAQQLLSEELKGQLGGD